MACGAGHAGGRAFGGAWPAPARACAKQGLYLQRALGFVRPLLERRTHLLLELLGVFLLLARLELCVIDPRLLLSKPAARRLVRRSEARRRVREWFQGTATHNFTIVVRSLNESSGRLPFKRPWSPSLSSE